MTEPQSRLSKSSPERSRRVNIVLLAFILALGIFCVSRRTHSHPRDAKTYYLIAQAHFKARDFRNASLAITQAIKLNPTQPQFHALSEEIQPAQTAESQH